ncbi:MAG: virulence factor, partial [Actinomycetes bacterium]
QLAPRLQEAIDEAAMRLGETGSDDYLAGWTRSEWLTVDGDPAELAATVTQRLESEWSDEQISRYLDSLG